MNRKQPEFGEDPWYSTLKIMGGEMEKPCVLPAHPMLPEVPAKNLLSLPTKSHGGEILLDMLFESLTLSETTDCKVF